MFEGRLMKKAISGVVAVLGLIYLLGAAGTIESGTFGFGSLLVRTVIGMSAVIIGAVMSGGLE